MNNFKAKNIILNLSGTSDLPYSTPNDVILKDNQSVNYGFNNSVQQLADNDMYIRHVLREQAEHQPGPERLTDESLAKTIDNYKYLHIDGNELSILQKHETAISATMTRQLAGKSVKKFFKDGRYFALADDGLYASTSLSGLSSGKLYNFSNCEIKAAVYDEDNHILIFGGSKTSLVGKIGVAYDFDQQSAALKFIDLYCNGAKLSAESVTSIEYDSAARVLYVGTTLTESKGFLYTVTNPVLNASNVNRLDLTQTWPIEDPVLGICKLSGNGSSSRILVGTYGSGMYESTTQYTFASLKDVYTFPEGTTTTCVVAIGNNKYVGTTTGLYVVNGTSATKIISNAKINNLKVIDGVCFVAASTGLYKVAENNAVTKFSVTGAVIDMCQKPNGVFAIAKSTGIEVAKTVQSTFESISALSGQSVLSIVQYDNCFYMATASRIYKVDVEFKTRTVTERSLVSWKNSSGKTFSQMVSSGTINKVVEINNTLYLLTTKGLYNVQFAKQYNISSNVYNIRKYGIYIFVCTSTGIYVIYGNKQIQRYANNEILDVFLNGSTLYVAVKSGQNTILCADTIDNVLVFNTADITATGKINLINGTAFTVAGIVESIVANDDRVFIVSSNKLLYVDIVETLNGVQLAPVLPLAAGSVNGFTYSTDDNFKYSFDIDDSTQYIGLTVSGQKKTYALGNDGTFSIVSNPQNILPAMVYNPVSTCKVNQVINVGNDDQITMFTNTAQLNAIYNFEQLNTTFSDVNIGTVDQLNAASNYLSKIIYANNINCILDVTTNNSSNKYCITNSGGQAFLAGTASGLYFHKEEIRSKQLSALNSDGTSDVTPVANLGCVAVAQYNAYQQVENNTITNAKELIYIAGQNTSNTHKILYACTLATRSADKNNKYEYADFKELKSLESNETVRKIKIMYNGTLPVGAYICTTKTLYFATIEFSSSTVNGAAVYQPTIKIEEFDVRLNNNASTILTGDFTDCEIAYGCLYLIADHKLYWSSLLIAEWDNDAQRYYLPVQQFSTARSDLQQFALTTQENGRVVGLCIAGSNNNVLVSIEHYGNTKNMRVVGSASGQSGTFSQPVVMMNAAGNIILATKVVISGKNYIAYITDYGDNWHRLRVDDHENDYESASGVTFKLNLFNTIDSSDGRIVGCVVQRDNRLYNVNIFNSFDFSDFADQSTSSAESELDFDDVAEESFEITSGTDIQNELFVASANDADEMADGVETISKFMMQTIVGGKATTYGSVLYTELDSSATAKYNIMPNVAVKCLAKDTVKLSPDSDAIIIAAGIGNTVQIMSYTGEPATAVTIEESESINYVCVDSNSHLILYVAGTKLKYARLKIFDVQGSVAISLDGSPTQIPTNIGTITGLFSANRKAYIVANAIYEVKHFIATTKAPANVDSFLNECIPLSLTSSNKLILSTKKNGQFEYVDGLSFTRIDNREDMFATTINDVTYAIVDGKLYIRNASNDGYSTMYSYDKVDNIYDSAVAIACYNGNGSICVVAKTDVKHIQTSSHVESYIQHIADIRSNSGATKLIEGKGNIIAYGKTQTMLVDEQTIKTVNLEFSPTLLVPMFSGFLAYQASTKKLQYVTDIENAIAYNVNAKQEILDTLVDAIDGNILLGSKLLSFVTVGQDLYFVQIEGTSGQVVHNICRVNDNEALFSMYIEKDKESVYWFRNNIFIKNQIHRNTQIACIENMNVVDMQTSAPVFAVLKTNGQVYISQNNKFTSWKLLFDMSKKAGANTTLYGIQMFTPYEYVVCVSNGLYSTRYAYTLSNNFSKTTQYDINDAITQYCASNVSSHLSAMHSTSKAAGKFIDIINNQLMPNDFSEMSPTWQNINNECTIIENDIVQYVEFGATGMHVSAMYANASDLSTWTNSTDFTYIDKQYKSNMHELYIYLPTTGTNYVPLPIFSNSANALSGIVANNATHIRVLLDPKHYDIQEMLEVQINANSLPLGITKTENEYGDEGKMFHSCVLPSVSKFAALTNNVSAECIPTLSGMYMFEFRCFGSDAQAIKFTFKSKNKYTVQFKADTSAYGYMEDQTFTVGETQNLAKNNYIKDGYLFYDWKYVNPAGSTVKYTDQQEIKSSFDSNNRSFTNNNDVKVQLSAEFEKYTFDGNETQITLNSDIGYISTTQTMEYQQTLSSGATAKLKGVVVDFGD